MLDPLDNLLNQSPLAEPSPWFAHRTLAHCRSTARQSSWSLGRLFSIKITAGFALASILVWVSYSALNLHALSVSQTEHQKRVQEAFSIVASSIQTQPVTMEELTTP